MTQDWTIQSRSHTCAATGRAFAVDESFYTLLYADGAGFRREDLCEEAFKTRNENLQPFSFWRTKYEPPAPAHTEAVTKQTAEDLLRTYMEDSAPGLENARFILALMLERKRILKEREVKYTPDGTLTRIYEHAKTGEVFLIADPQLHLTQVADIQAQVASQLGAPTAQKTPQPQPASAPATEPEPCAPPPTEISAPS